MKLRTDPTANALMAGAFTRNNATMLAARLGRDADRGRALSSRIFSAPNGAGRLIGLAESQAADVGSRRVSRRRAGQSGRSSTTGRATRAASATSIARWSAATTSRVPERSKRRMAERTNGAEPPTGAAAVLDPAALAEPSATAAPPLPAAVSIDGGGPVFRDLFQADATASAGGAGRGRALVDAGRRSPQPDRRGRRCRAASGPRKAPGRRSPAASLRSICSATRPSDVGALFRGRG